MIEMRDHSRSLSSAGVTFVHDTPPLRVTCTVPSSVPAQITPFVTGDSAIANTVPYVSTPVWSFVIGPPDGPSVRGSLRDRSGLMAV